MTPVSTTFSKDAFLFSNRGQRRSRAALFVCLLVSNYLSLQIQVHTPMSSPPRRRSSRAAAIREKKQHQLLQRKQDRAAALMSTPLLQALPTVLSSGYLYLFECIKAASLCQNWYFIWKEVELKFPKFPDDASVIYSVQKSRNQNQGPTHFVHQNGLLQAMQSPIFARTIYDKINQIKLAGKKGQAAKAKFLKSVKIWGVGIHRVDLVYWGANVHNGGGICIAFYQGESILSRRTLIRLHPDLTIWTGIRNWKDYDSLPLWP